MIESIKRLLAARRASSEASKLDEPAILAHTRRAFAGELPITREKVGNLGVPCADPDGEVLTIEPIPGQKIVVGTTVRGKALTHRAR